MRLGTAIVLLALGRVLTFALNVDVSGIDLQVVGWILMIVGALGIVLELADLGSAYSAASPGPTPTATPPVPRSAGAPPRRPTERSRSAGRRAPCARTGAQRARRGPDR